jgi:OstA-like protein
MRIAVLCTLFLFCILNVRAQNEPDLLELIEGAQMIEYHAKKKAHRLIGPVNFKYKGSVMFCDSAHFFDKEQIVIAYGKVQLDSKDIAIRFFFEAKQDLQNYGGMYVFVIWNTK